MYLVNTSASEAALRASLSQSWRQKLKRAEKTDISVRFAILGKSWSNFFACTTKCCNESNSMIAVPGPYCRCF